MLGEGLTSREIAEKLTLANTSVRWYLHQIYSKLGVNGKRPAIQQARELGLLAPIKTPASQDPQKLDLVFPASTGSPATARLPIGTVTFLFTDIEGSTPLWEWHPDQMAAALQIHNSILRKAIESQGGIVYKTVGDSFQAAFATAPQALRAAIQGQKALQSAPWNDLGPLKVRMGIHTGEAQLDPGGDEYAVSHTKNRAARIMSAAHGGQILLSQETKELVDHQLPESVTLKDLGENRLKGISIPERLFQVCAPGLPQDFPILATAITHPHNLPVQLTSFIGRQEEIAGLIELLSTHRLVTLNGSGGAGKTRLSLQVAEKVLDRYPDGVWLVELAPLADPVQVSQAVASVLGLQKSGESSYLTILTDNLRSKHLLLLLDNCEHVLEACADLTHHLIQHCPSLSLLTTSREPLGIDGEVGYRVPSLEAPDPALVTDPQELAQADAIQLFSERAASLLPGFALNAETLPAVANICRRLDGIPLAIELAAARIDVLGVAQIAARLTDRFRLLTGGSRTALPRQRTLRASIDWSYSLLKEPERLLLQQLSVFSGGWTLEAVEGVYGGNEQEEWEILETHTSLVKKSLIVAESSSGTQYRYSMLETIRQFAQEKLDDSGLGARARERHQAYFLTLAQDEGPRLKTMAIMETLARLNPELDNLRSAITWALGKGDQSGAEQALDILISLDYLWAIHGLYWETFPRILQALERIPEHEPASAELRAWGYYVLSTLQSDHNIESETLVYLNQSVKLFRKTSNRQGLALSLSLRSYLTFRYNFFFPPDPAIRDEDAVRDQEESFAIANEFSHGIDDKAYTMIGWVNCWNGAGEIFHQNYRIASNFGKQAQESFRKLGDVIGELHGWLIYIAARKHMGDRLEIIPYTDLALELARRINHKWFQTLFYTQNAEIYYDLGMYPEFEANFWPMTTLEHQIGFARAIYGSLSWACDLNINLGNLLKAQFYLRQALNSTSEEIIQKYIFQVLNFLFNTAKLAYHSSRYTQTASLLGFLGMQLAGFSIRNQTINHKQFILYKDKASEVLGDNDFQVFWQKGQKMALEQAIALAREVIG